MSSREEKRREESPVLNNCNKYSEQNVKVSRGRIVYSYSFPCEKVKVHQAFDKIAERDFGRRGRSDLIQQLIEKHVKAHEAGNENFQISSYLDKMETPSPHHLLCNYVKGVRRDGFMFCGNPSMIRTHEAVLVSGFYGNWVNGVVCFACRFNKVKKGRVLV